MRLRVFLSCLTALLTMSPWITHAEDSSAVLVVHVIDCATVAPSEKNVAQHAVRRAFGTAGIRIKWVDQPPKGAEDLGPDHVAIVLIPRNMVDRKATYDQVPRNALATAAAPPVRRAWVFIDRVTDVAYLQHVSLGEALGTVIAHEIAHVAGGMSHTEHGIMGRDLRMYADSVVGFNPDQGRRILAAMQSPVARGGLPVNEFERMREPLRPERLEARR